MEAAWDSRVQCSMEDVVAKVYNAGTFSNENECDTLVCFPESHG
jgi:hypothetical protein